MLTDTSLTEFVGDLAADIEGAWAQADFEEGAFSAIATERVRAARVWERVTPTAVVDWALATGAMPEQHDLNEEFGQPSITLYNGRRFHVDVLFWLDATTAIHQHFFSGCFCVLGGGSVHSTYRFEARDRVSSRMLFGDLDLLEMELLRPGDVRPVLAGPRFIHALFHLEHPSVTLVVRTFPEPEVTPQYNYFPPRMALAQKSEDQVTTRQLQVLGMLATSGDPQLPERFVGCLAHWPFDVAFRAFERLQPTLAGTPGAVEQVQAALLDRWPRHAGEIAPTLELMRLKESIAALRATVTDPELRFFLALLLNAPDRRWIDELVRAFDSTRDPAELLGDWLERLCREYDAGLQLGQGALQVARRLIAGEAEQALIERACRGESDELQVRERLQEVVAELRAVPMLRPLFVGC